jgi:hypothetical protein
VSLLAPAGSLPAHTLPDSAQEGVDTVRPVLTAGGQPGTVVVLVDIEAQGVAAS